MIGTCQPKSYTLFYLLVSKNISLGAKKNLRPREFATKMRGNEEHHKEEKELGVWDCGSPLYDSYELVSVSHLIERHLMALPYSLGGSRRFIANFCTHPSSGMASTVSSDMRSSTTREAKGSSSSIVGIRKIWKRMVFFGEGKDKANKRKLGFSGFCNMIGLWRQKDQCR